MPADTIARKRRAFQQMHRAGCFVLPNPWDVGSARALAGMGFQALATTSAGFAWSSGRPDGGLSRSQVLAHMRMMAESVDIPVNADFESGFGATLSELEESVHLALQTGVAGLSLEDSTGNPPAPLMPLDDAVERIGVARSVIDRAGGETLLVGRAENFFVGVPDLDDAIARLKAYAAAGADCLYAPGIRTREQVRAVVAAVAPKPVNVLIGWDSELTVNDLAELGVRRISVGGALARAAWSGFLQAARSLAAHGRFQFPAGMPAGAELNVLFRHESSE